MLAARGDSLAQIGLVMTIATWGNVVPIMFGGGLIGLKLMSSHRDISEKRIAVVDRSGAVAQGLYAINCYLGTRWGENKPEDHVRYARIDLMGMVREDLLFDMARAEGATLILITHDMALAARCDRLLRLADGRIVSDERNPSALAAQ